MTAQPDRPHTLPARTGRGQVPALSLALPLALVLAGLAACQGPRAGDGAAARPTAGASAPAATRVLRADAPASSPAARAAAADADVVVPNANLFVQGIPPIPAKLAQAVQRYGDFRGHSLVDWHPTRREMLVAHRKAGAATTQLFRVASPMAEPEQITDGPDPISRARYEPREGRYLVYAMSSGGSEADQLYRLDLDVRSGHPRASAVRLTDPARRHAIGAFLNRRAGLLTTSVPLDRPGEGGRQDKVETVLALMDPLQPAAARTVATLDGGGWFVSAVSRDDRQVALARYISATESQAWVLDLATGRLRQVLPAPAAAGAPADKAGGNAGAAAVYLPEVFSADGKHLFVLSDRDAEVVELVRLDLASGAVARVTNHIPWDVSEVRLSPDGRTLALQANVDGRDELRLVDAQTLRERARAPVPPGSLGAMEFDAQRGELALTVNNAKGPNQLVSVYPGAGKWDAWTQPYAPPGIDTSRFEEPELVRWKSFDGRLISALLHRPPARFAGPRPVMLLIHGGPEQQAKAGFMGRFNHYLHEMGIAIIEPNVRGSSGYGKTFLGLDNGRLREDAVKDIGTLLDWIATQPTLDARRVVVMGGSYGGYMSLATAVHYSDRIAGAVDIVGISNFVTFLTNTESYRRDLRRVEYGDERDPQMRAFLESISPLTHAARIRKPLFVVQGRNDPRVPYTEAEQIVERVRRAGGTVWYLRAENEGHGFARKENADFQFYATVRFLEETLLKP